jgi:hypothetical protein
MQLGYLTEPVRALLAAHGNGERAMELDFRDPVLPAPQAALAQLKPSEAFPGAPSAEGALSGLWLYFNGMDEAHGICQDLDTAEGSFWHAILHRREPDASNAAYWFRRVGHHDIFPALLARAQELIASHPEAEFAVGNRWDPFAFVDFCETARKRRGSLSEQLAKEIQLIEWQLLFEHCARGNP